MTRSVSLYELEGHRHRGLFIGIARHSKYAPFACNAPLALHIELNPMRHVAGEALVTERCQGCGKVVNVWRVSSPVLMRNDDQDEGA